MKAKKQEDLTGDGPGQEQRRRAMDVLGALQQAYPDAECELAPRDPWRLLCAVILSAQCTDVRVNQTTPVLFARYPTADLLAAANPADVEEIVKSTGFFRDKARNLIAMSQDLVERFHGVVPQTLEELTSLPGVGRKTANVILGVVFGGDAVVVDTHVKRLSARLGWSSETDPVKIEQDLMALFPRKTWTPLSHTLIFHGRRCCAARAPHCEGCPVRDRCPEGSPGLRSQEPPS